jgi:hypothetical protein
VLTAFTTTHSPAKDVASEIADAAAVLGVPATLEELLGAHSGDVPIVVAPPVPTTPPTAAEVLERFAASRSSNGGNAPRATADSKTGAKPAPVGTGVFAGTRADTVRRLAEQLAQRLGEAETQRLLAEAGPAIAAPTGSTPCDAATLALARANPFVAAVLASDASVHDTVAPAAAEGLAVAGPRWIEDWVR